MNVGKETSVSEGKPELNVWSKLFKSVILLMTSMFFVATAYAGGRPTPLGTQGDNIALDCPYTWNYIPNYTSCSDNDPDDETQLTDGEYTSGYFWTQTTTVGWAFKTSPIVITIDLGVSQPIQGISYSTAGGVAGVYFPHQLDVEFSNDNINFYDSVDLANEDPPPSYGIYNTHSYDADNLTTHGRYVRFTVYYSGNYMFVDEIRVIRGANSLLGDNLVLGKTFSWNYASNYSLCSNGDDAAQLTDGIYTSGYFWTESSTVGWVYINPPIILTVDLGADKAIEGLSFNTAGGNAGVTWPRSINLLVSADNTNFYNAGELIQLSVDHGLPANEDGHQTKCYWTDRLNVHGRYVKLVICGYKYVFVDEIEIYEGRNEMLSLSMPGVPITDYEEFAEENQKQAMAARRIVLDAQDLQDQVDNDTELTTAEKALFTTDITDIIYDAMYMIINQSTYELILPVDTIHENLFKTQAYLWQAQGRENLIAWGAKPWERTKPTQAPDGTSPNMSVRMLQYEYRSGVFNLSNSTDSDLTVNITIKYLPGGDNPDYIKVREAKWIDTIWGEAINSPLVDVPLNSGSYPVIIPAGMTSQIWLTAHPLTTNPGTYNGTIVANGGTAGTVNIPISLEISPLAFPEQPTLGLGGFDYTNTVPIRALTASNRSEFIALAKEYFVNMPWATNAVMPSTPNYTAFDNWRDIWSNVRDYHIYLAVSDSFGGYSGGTTGFNSAVASWINSYASHWNSEGIDMDRIKLHLVDEPSSSLQTDTISHWAYAIKAAQPNIKIWLDCGSLLAYDYSTLYSSYCDILCPHRPSFLVDSTYQSIFRTQRDTYGKTLNFYSCQGPTERLDPYSYYRLQAWTCWDEEATAMFYWSLTDQGDAASWKKDYPKHFTYSPMFFETDAVIPGKAMEAIREGVEDYEYLRMLEDLVNGGASLSAETLLDEAPGDVLDANNANNGYWSVIKDRTVADDIRQLILDELEAHAPGQGDNCAEGCSYTWNYTPNYAYCTDSGDITQLTDGEYAPEGIFWSQTETVGWFGGISPLRIIIDLDSIQPIQAIKYSTCAGTSGVYWPSSLDVAVSNDGVNFTSVCDLQQEDPAPASGRHVYDATGLSVYGRYVRFTVTYSGNYTFIDEIEVIRGAID